MLPIRKAKLQSELKEILCEQRGDCLIILLYMEHYYVLLLSEHDHIIFSCDSSNNDHNINLRPLLATFLVGEFQLRQLQFQPSGRFGVDHCGSGAASIALEMIRMYRAEDSTALGLPSLTTSSFIKPSKSILSTMISRLHKTPSRAVSGWMSIQMRQKLVCDRCSNFKTWKRSCLANHQRKCHDVSCVPIIPDK